MKSKVNFIKTDKVSLSSKVDDNKKYIHICEICGKREILTAEEGYNRGWDYSPRMYPFSIISPRTCGNCGIENTVWAEITLHHKSYDELTESQKEVVARIYAEPESILVKE